MGVVELGEPSRYCCLIRVAHRIILRRKHDENLLAKNEEGCCKMYRNGHARTRSSNVQITTHIRPCNARYTPRHGTNEGYGSLEEHATIFWTTTTTRFTTRPRWTTTTSPKRRYVQENDDENDVEKNVQRRLIKPLRKHGFILI